MAPSPGLPGEGWGEGKGATQPALLFALTARPPLGAASRLSRIRGGGCGSWGEGFRIIRCRGGG